MDFRKGFKSTNKAKAETVGVVLDFTTGWYWMVLGFITGWYWMILDNWVVLDFHNYYKQWKRPSLRLNIARLEDKGNPWSTKHCRKYIQ